MNKKLKRSNNQIVGGVCAGIGNYFNWDYTIVRAVYALLSIFSGAFPGLTLYIILWIIMPLGDE
ncbi:MAG: PspC domain-containing protein [Paludibacter sp.]